MKKHDPKYDRYIEQAMKIGEVTNWETWEGVGIDRVEHHDRERFERDLDTQVEIFEYEDACIADGKCPGCGGALSKRIDPRQVGPVELELHAGQWINYRCTAKCEWMGVDRKEPIGEN